jgi:acyl carrier protein
MTSQSVMDAYTATIKQIIIDQTAATEPLTLETDLLNDLALDSLELVEVGVKIEKKFGRKLSINRLRQCITLGELIELTREMNEEQKVLP